MPSHASVRRFSEPKGADAETPHGTGHQSDGSMAGVSFGWSAGQRVGRRPAASTTGETPAGVAWSRRPGALATRTLPERTRPERTPPDRTLAERTLAERTLTERALPLALALALLIAILPGCRRTRSLEELERVQATGEDAALVPRAAPLTVDEGYARLLGLYAPPDREPLVERTERLERGDVLDLPVPLEAGACVYAQAFGLQPGADVDLAIYSPDGQVLGLDDAPDALPVVQLVCAERAGTHTLRLGNRAGPVDVRVGLFLVVRGAMTNALLELLARDAPQARPYTPIRTAWLPEGEVLEAPLLVRSGACYTFAAVGTPEVEDVDIEVLAGDERVGIDVGTDATPVLRSLCATRDELWTVRLRQYAGGGPVRWVVALDEPQEAPPAFEFPRAAAVAGDDRGR